MLRKYLMLEPFHEAFTVRDVDNGFGPSASTYDQKKRQSFHSVKKQKFPKNKSIKVVIGGWGLPEEVFLYFVE